MTDVEETAFHVPPDRARKIIHQRQPSARSIILKFDRNAEHTD